MCTRVSKEHVFIARVRYLVAGIGYVLPPAVSTVGRSRGWTETLVWFLNDGVGLLPCFAAERVPRLGPSRSLRTVTAFQHSDSCVPKMGVMPEKARMRASGFSIHVRDYQPRQMQDAHRDDNANAPAGQQLLRHSLLHYDRARSGRKTCSKKTKKALRRADMVPS